MTRTPTDEQIVACLAGGVPDPEVEALVVRLTGAVEPVGLRPRWGCSLTAHDRLGWCCNCPRITPAAELMAWRITAAGHPTPDVVWARAVTVAP